MERTKRARLAAALAGVFVVLAVVTGIAMTGVVRDFASRTGSDVYATYSIPERNQAIVLFTDGAGGKLALYDDEGSCVRSVDNALAGIAREGQALYMGFVEIVDNEAILAGMFQSQYGNFTDVVFYGVDLDTLELHRIVALSDFVDMAVYGLTYAQPYVGADHGDFGILLSQSTGTAEEGSASQIYRYFRLNKEDDGYSCTWKDVSGHVYSAGGFSQRAGLVLIDLDGNILAPDVSSEPIFVDDGSRIGTANSNYTVYPDGIEFYNVDTDRWAYLRFDDLEHLNFSDTQQGLRERLEQAGYDTEDLSSISVDGEGYFTASYVDNAGETVYVYERADHTFFTLSRYFPNRTVLMAVTAAVVVIPVLLEGVILVLVYRYAVKYGFRVTVFGKIFVALTAIFVIIAYGSTSVIDSIMGEQAVSSARAEVYSYGLGACALPDRDRLNELSRGETELNEGAVAPVMFDFASKTASLNVDQDDVALMGAQNDVDQLFMYNLLYLYRDGKVYLLSGGNPVDAPIDEATTSHASELERACKTNQVVEVSDVQSSNSLIFPIQSPSGDEVIGALEVTYSTSFVGYANATAIRTMLVGVLGLIAALFMAMLVWLKLSLRSIGRLGVAVHELMEGNMDVRVPERGIDEVASIGRTFNRMVENLGNRVRDQKASTDQYARFIPTDTVRQLGHDRIADVKLGDYSVFQTATLNVACLNFNAAAGSTPREMYAFINAHLPVQIDIVGECGGVVNQIDEAGLEAYFRDQVASALKAAVRIASFLNRESVRSGSRAVFTCVLGYGETALGVVGNTERAALENVSHQAAVTERLLAIARDFKVEVLMTQAFVDRLRASGERTLAARRIGSVRFTHATEHIYEVLDGIDPEQRRCRLESLRTFDAGVASFVRGDYLEAHRHFADVLRANGSDSVALRYFYLCDRGLEGALELTGVIDDIEPRT